MFLPTYAVLNGNLGQDPKEIPTGDGKQSMCSFSVACSQGKDEPPVWCEVTAFGFVADGVMADLTAGSSVIVTAAIRLDTWESDGGKRSKIKFVAHDVAIKVKSPF